MEIRDPIHGSIQLSDGEVAIIESVEFQRLRQIKQLGFSEFSFPGATHNRFLHSIGVSYVAGQIFDSIFRAYPFSKPSVKTRLRQTVKLAALLHDIGHGPLSHTTEDVMPNVRDLKIQIYGSDLDRQANHEDYTIKFVTESTVAQLIRQNFSDIDPLAVAALIDRSLHYDDTFFIDAGINFRPILSQIVSSELDADRMDYLERDSYFCGINYGKIDKDWLQQNLTLHIKNEKAFLALNRRALYAFDDFLISRHHMHLMVYFHHKSIIYEEMLSRYLNSQECSFFLPADSNEYTAFTDYKLYEHLASVQNHWARRIAQRRPFKVALELHNQDSTRIDRVQNLLNSNALDFIYSSSNVRLSKYHSDQPDTSTTIYVVDQYDKWDVPSPVNQATQIFQKYEGARVIDRFYVAPENFDDAKSVLDQNNF